MQIKNTTTTTVQLCNTNIVLREERVIYFLIRDSLYIHIEFPTSRYYFIAIIRIAKKRRTRDHNSPTTTELF